MKTKKEEIMRLEKIKNEMLELIGEAEAIIVLLSNEFPDICNDANSYWIPHITIAITNNHDYLAGSMANFEDTIEKLKNKIE